MRNISVRLILILFLGVLNKMSHAQVQKENICLNQNQENGFCNVLNTHCMFTEPNLLQKNLDPNLDYIKSQRSDFWTDFDKYETSILADCPQKLNIKILEANSPSFHMTKSFHMADTADTFFNPNHSISILDIPSERAQTKDCTTYVRNLKSKDSLDNNHNLKRFSFGNNKSNSAKPKSRAASRYQDPPTEFKTRELMWSFDLGGQSSSKDIIVSELDVFSSGKIPTSFQSQTVSTIEKEESAQKEIVHHHENKIKPKKNEYSKQMINDLKKKIKIEEAKELEARTKIKQFEIEIIKMNKRTEVNEKKYYTMKVQNENLRKEMIDLLQLNDEYKEGSSQAKENIKKETSLIEIKKEEIKNFKSLISNETKSKDQVKESVEKLRKNLAKLSYTIELLVLEKNKYQSMIQ